MKNTIVCITQKESGILVHTSYIVMLLRFQSSNGDVIDHALHFLNVVLESIKFLPQIVVLEIK